MWPHIPQSLTPKKRLIYFLSLEVWQFLTFHVGPNYVWSLRLMSCTWCHVSKAHLCCSVSIRTSFLLVAQSYFTVGIYHILLIHEIDVWGFSLFFFFCLVAFSRATAPAAYGGSQTKGRIGAAATGLHQSHSNSDLSLICDLHHSSR